MTRDQIENHGRAAHYLNYRARGMAATPAWQQAAKGVERYQARAEQYRAAGDALAALWERLGKVEPKRYSPEGQELAEARKAQQQAAQNLRAVSAYRGDVRSPYAGTWQPQQPGHYYAEQPESMFRGVETADAINPRLPRGYYDNSGAESAPDGSGLVIGIVAQLRGRDGCARFIPGYRFGSYEDIAGTFDTRDIYESTGDDYESAWRDAAHAADGLAASKAEAMRDADSAYQAGARWARLGDDIAEARQACLALLAERRAAMAQAGGRLPAICNALRDTVAGYCQTIAEARAERAELASGAADCLWWDSSNLSDFASGAELTIEQARGVAS